jgi:uncharacterized repeat protein (TIGR03803 family)
MEEGLRYFSPVRNDGNRVAGADFHHPAHLRLLGRLVTLCGADPGHRWEPLRDDVSGRNQRRWHGLQNHPKRHPEDPLQLLLPKWVRGRERSIRGLVQVGSGNLYGTTQQGGPNNGSGTVFKITLSGTLTTLHNFDTTDGRYPYAGLVQASNGNFYGTTYFGGANSEGAVFKITPTGTLTTLHSFANTDGIRPQAGLVQASNGNLYGTTQGGGTNNEGTVFKITPGGTLTSLHSFCSQTGCPDGSSPYAGLVQATDGNLYGTTVLGGADGEGTIFKITPSGTLTTLLSFAGTNGAQPYAGLIQATDGNLYGTTKFGGANNDGTIFKITLSGTLTTLHSFDATDGSDPYAALVQDTNGSFYGTTLTNGSNTYGTVFRLSVGLQPFVETQTTSGKVGAAVKILGTKLTGATSVTFNGTAAVFKVVSNSLITTTVPQGATTGFISVTTPQRKLKSNRKFVVTR